MSDEWIKHDGGPRPAERRKFYHKDWQTADLLKARFGGLCTDSGEAWIYEYTSMDGVGGPYDLLWRHLDPTAPVSATPPADADEAFIRDTAAQIMAACAGKDMSGSYTPHMLADLAIAAAEALAAKLKGRKA